MSGLISRPGVVVGGLAAAGITGVCLYLLLKREEEWKLQRQRGLSSSKQVVIDVKIPKESVGVVIGREGSNIREIQAKTDTRINFKDELETGTHRVASIRGLSEDCQMAEILIHQTIANQPRIERLTMFVPVSCVGRIIGRQGDNIREIQRISGCRVDVERGDHSSTIERKVTLKGTSQQLSAAKKLIEEKVEDAESMRERTVSSRQPRVRNQQPLFLSYQDDATEEVNHGDIGCKQEVLELLGGDNVLEVFVSGVESPGEFYVQKIGRGGTDLDKLTEEMTLFYNDETNIKLMAVDSVEAGDIVAAKFTEEENFYRAKIVSVEENTYDFSQSTVELFYLDFGDSDEKAITEIYQLKTDFLRLNFQAIKVSLANVRPAQGSSWSEESIDLFCQMTHCARWKMLWAKIQEYNEENVPIVELIDSSQNETNIGQELIKLGVAAQVGNQ